MRCRYAMATLVLCAAGGSARGFEYFEHRAVGNAALVAAYAEVRDHRLRSALDLTMGQMGLQPVEPGAPIDRPSATSPMSIAPLGFGDLAALAGDFEETPDELAVAVTRFAEFAHQNGHAIRDALDETWGTRYAVLRASRLEWLSACRWHRRVTDRVASSGTEPPVDRCFDDTVRGERNAVPDRTFSTLGYRPSRWEQSAYEQVANYASLASRNSTHFPQKSWVMYASHHRLALRWAEEYRRQRRSVPDDASDDAVAPLLRSMLIEEGFAQHFLHDSFASGHIGTNPSECPLRLFGKLPILCEPTLGRMQQTHDVLNEIGLRVRMPSPVSGMPMDAPALRSGWMASGDGHLFLPEAAFHRWALHQAATLSLRELLQRAAGEVPTGAPCITCSSNAFPVPVETYGTAHRIAVDDVDTAGFVPQPLIRFSEAPYALTSRTPDPRVPGLPQEGWKVGLGYGDETDRRTDSTGIHAYGALVFRIDYARPTEAAWPGAYGFEGWNTPKRGWSYLGNVGWSFPREVASMGVTVKLKAGLRMDENFTESNPTPVRSRSFNLVFPSVEYHLELYRPLSLYLQANLASYSSQDKRWKLYRTQGQRFGFGVRFDLTGV